MNIVTNGLQSIVYEQRNKNEFRRNGPSVFVTTALS